MNYTWIITAVALAGTIINVYKSSWCFIFWCFSNTAWCLWNLHIGQTPLAVQFFIYLLISIYGLVKWRREERRRWEIIDATGEGKTEIIR